MVKGFLGHLPRYDPTVFIESSANVIGDVEIGAYASIWFGAVVRGDVHYIRIGRRTNIQDLSILHVTRVTHPLVIGDEITVGHGVTLHGCTVKDRSLVGMGAVLLDGCIVGEESIVGAGALVPEGMEVPPRSLAVGVPAKIRRTLSDEELAFLSRSAQNYVELAQVYLKEGRT